MKKITKAHETALLVDHHGYQANGVTYLPHYRNDSLFVGPGYPKQSSTVYTVDDLLKAGATRINLMLWARGKTGAVSTSNP
jgi:hypothetical protein